MPRVSVKVLELSVVGSIASLKVALIVPLRARLVALSAGVLAVSFGVFYAPRSAPASGPEEPHATTMDSDSNAATLDVLLMMGPFSVHEGQLP